MLKKFFYKAPNNKYMMKIFSNKNNNEEKDLVLLGILHSVGVFLYVALVVWFMNSAGKFIGPTNEMLAGMTMLMIFILSALITSSLVLGRPILYYLDGKKKQALKLLFYTTASLFVWLLLAIGELMLLK